MKNNKAVTLIALIITIIILLILAGVVIAMTVGDNGLIKKALLAEEKYENAQNAEQKALEELEKQIANYNKGLPENTPDTKAGTEVKIPTDWYSTTSDHIPTNVTAVAGGKGKTVPVPKGFYYVGGTSESGVVISDDSRDKNKYAGELDVPAGAIYNSDGTVKTYTDAEYNALSADSKKAVLLGNQFVWIPCTENEYVKKDWGKANATWERQTNTAELPQIQKYGGFYIGRYQAGTSNITLSTGIDFAVQNTASNWVNDKFSIRDGLNHTVESGKITTKAGEIPYYHSDYETALKLSNNMYNTDYVQSGLITGTMWDAMMKFITKINDTNSDETIVTKSTWGNYTDGTVTYLSGKGRYALVDSSNGAINTTGDIGFVVSDGKYHYGIKTTAISEDVKKKNLYDVAGNLWEITTESCISTYGSLAYVVRGGAFNESYTHCPACYRGQNHTDWTDTNRGFRPALYIK